ncbi:TPA: signal peptidase II [Candidatus Woesearchaeota archaeon]|nr:signal peptidase II [Candidatus Woesearchaeota archaeon]HII68438.1 signal peptidase II [Candidatus Woesearchaeota archaeon]
MAHKLERRDLLLFSSLIIIFLADQLTKLAALSFLAMRDTTLLHGILTLNLTFNTGAGFSILQGKQALLIAISFAIVLLILATYRKFGEGSPFLFIAMGALAGGALGNAIDRIRLGYVIDFIDFQVWPVFNVADSAITVAGIFLAIYFWKKSNH